MNKLNKIKRIENKTEIYALMFAFITVDAVCNSVCLFEFMSYFGFVLGIAIPCLIYRLERIKNKPFRINVFVMSLIIGSFATSIIFVFLVDINKSETRYQHDKLLSDYNSKYKLLKQNNIAGWKNYYSLVNKNRLYPAQKLRESLEIDTPRIKDLENKISMRESELKNVGSKFSESIPFKKYSKLFLAYMGMLTPIGIISTTYLAGLHIPGFIKDGKKRNQDKTLSQNMQKHINGRISVKLAQNRNNELLTDVNNRSTMVNNDQPVSLGSDKRAKQIKGVRLTSDVYIELINNNIEPYAALVRKKIRIDYQIVIPKSSFRNYFLAVDEHMRKVLPEIIEK